MKHQLLAVVRPSICVAMTQLGSSPALRASHQMYEFTRCGVLQRLAMTRHAAILHYEASLIIASHHEPLHTSDEK